MTPNRPFLLTLLVIAVGYTAVVYSFPRWEGRTIDCTTKPDTCYLVAKDDAKYPCVTEPMPKRYEKSGKTRLSCPMACETASRLSVVARSPETRGCVQWQTFGKYWKYADGRVNGNETKYLKDAEDGDWFFWWTPKCAANLTTWCQFGY